MYLKRLDLYGFKSFADKTTFEFKPGVTLVVGPNGSGKSNIADAIRWVLGEQSAKTLRGGKMEDVIFSGSEKRKSLGMAEVSLTIDNTGGGLPIDFSEVTITRRLYRSGESEYLINKAACRLREIHELFMDTGVGREGFSLIGQGRVDEILLARPDEKRVILEDAAGIIKYRYRKKDATKKLEETGQHLLRIEDLLLELQSKEAPLASQAEEAKAYRELKEELDGLEIGMMVSEIRQALERLAKQKEEIESLQEAILTQRAASLSAEGREAGVRLALDEINEEINRLQQAVYQHSIAREKTESELRSETERGEETRRQAGSLLEEAAKQEIELKEYQARQDARKEKEAELAGQVAIAEKLVEEEQAAQTQVEASMETIRETLEKGDSDLFELARLDSAKQNQEVGYRESVNSSQRQKERLAQAGEKLERDLRENRGRIESLEARYVYCQAEDARIRKIIGSASQALDEAAEKHRAKQQNNRALAAERGQALSKFRLLDEMEKEGQGYAQGVREILRRRSQERLPGILGTVAQNIRVDKEYELAVETALGGQAQNIITETERSAQDAIRWLKSFDKGRVTFLPLDTVRNRPVREDSRPKGKGVIGRLVDLADFEDRLLPAMEFTLGRIWLVDELSNAIARARETDFQYRMVTLDGQMVNAGGSLTGGSARLSGGGFISRRRELGELDRDIRQMSKDLVDGEREENALLEALNTARSSLEEAKETLRDNTLASAAISNDLSHSRQEEERLLAERELTRRQREDEDLEKDRIIALLEGLSVERKRLEQEMTGRRAEMDALRQELELTRSQRANRQSRMSELRIQLAADKERLNSFDAEGSFIRDRIEQIKSVITTQKENSEMCMDRFRRHSQAARQRSLEIAAIDEKIALLEREKEEASGKRLALQEEEASLDESQRAINAEINKNQERRQQLLILESRLQANLDEWKNRLSEQFSLDWEHAIETIKPVQDRRGGARRVRELREQIEAMPEVNLRAVSEYEELLKRLKLVSGQTDDLRRGKADLEAVIREMDEIVSKKFKQTFDSVNAEFNAIFQRLFDGGQASLVLTEPNDPLETGVDIIAQPPGKKLQHLSLLSGGEKSLTAISLLMAMLRVRPSPFSILDEIESNLDDANVDRFAGLIREYRDSGGQFIIITHRRGTMVAGDVIYGVAAQEFSGVSRVISVRMEEDSG